jgi:hypothetical protein
MRWEATWEQIKYWVGDAGEVALLYREQGWGMMMARLTIIAVCFVWIASLLVLQSAHAQVPSHNTNTDIAVQQAVTQVQVTANYAELNNLRHDLSDMAVQVNSLRDDLSTVKGIGMGAAAVIGLLQTLQMILQVRAVKRP